MEHTRLRRFDRARPLVILAGAMLLLSACGSTTTTGTADAKTATSAADMGGMSALVTAAKAEGKLNVIALPPNWCDYGDAISAFTAKYGIAVNSENPNGSSQQEVDAINQNAGTSTAPDVVDVGLKVAVSNTSVFAPYKVTTWGDIPGSLKESTGLPSAEGGG